MNYNIQARTPTMQNQDLYGTYSIILFVPITASIYSFPNVEMTFAFDNSLKVWR